LPQPLARPEARPPEPPPATAITRPTLERTLAADAEPSHESTAPRASLTQTKQTKPTKRKGASPAHGGQLHAAGDLKAPY